MYGPVSQLNLERASAMLRIPKEKLDRELLGRIATMEIIIHEVEPEELMSIQTLAVIVYLWTIDEM